MKMIILIAILLFVFGILRLILGFWPFVQQDPQNVAVSEWAQKCETAGGVPDLMAGCIKKDAFIIISN